MKPFVLHVLLSLFVVAQVKAEAPIITCPSEPPHVRRLQLQERWRIDVDDPDAPLLGYTNPSQVLTHEGQVYLLDHQLCHILVYSEDGDYLRTIMREGDGPGEIRNPGAMSLLSDGRIAVKHGYPSKMEFVDVDGTPRGRWRLQANAWVNRFQETPLGWFAVYTESKNNDEPGSFTSVFHAALHDDDGIRTQEFHSETKKRNHLQGGTTDEADEYNPWYTTIAIGGDQIVYAAARDQYRLEWRNLSGEVTRIVIRDFAAHRRTDSELEQMKYSNYSISYGELIFPDRKLCDLDPMIHSLEPLPDGCLLVRSSYFEKDLPPGMVCRFEVHEPTGELRERVEIYDPSGDYDVDYDSIALLDDGSAMVLRNLRPAYRSATDARLHPKLLEKMPPIPDDREDIVFTPIMCDLVPFPESEESVDPAKE